jgi:hypothetical protein
VSVEANRSALRATKERAAEVARPARKPRADGQRNRDRLMETAKAAFADVGADVSLD